MSIVAAKCPQCGANLQVDNSKEAGICPSCGTPFITEKAVNNYQVQVTQNIGTVINVGETTFEKEKKQANVLVMLLSNLDIPPLKDRALRVLDLNPDNSFAMMIYSCDFREIPVLGEYKVYAFNEAPLVRYFNENKGDIDLDTSAMFVRVLCRCPASTEAATAIMRCILDNINARAESVDKVGTLYNAMLGDLCDMTYIKYLKEAKFQSTAIMVQGALNQGFNGVNTDVGGHGAKGRATTKGALSAIQNTRKVIAQMMLQEIAASRLSAGAKRSFTDFILNAFPKLKDYAVELLLIPKEVAVQEEQVPELTPAEKEEKERARAKDKKEKIIGISILAAFVIIIIGVLCGLLC